MIFEFFMCHVLRMLPLTSFSGVGYIVSYVNIEQHVQRRVLFISGTFWGRNCSQTSEISQFQKSVWWPFDPLTQLNSILLTKG